MNKIFFCSITSYNINTNVMCHATEIHLMKQLIITILLFNFIALDTNVFGQENSLDTKHFYSMVDKAQFDTLQGADFTWIIFQPINDTLSYTPFSKRHAFVEKF